MRPFLSGVLMVCLFGVLLCGCETAPVQPDQPERISINSRSTVGDVCKLYSAGAIPVRGIGLVAGLPGTGSSECPPRIREQLEKYIWQQIPGGNSPLNPSILIESRNTAVVEVLGLISPLATKGDIFDVMVRPLSSTQTTSLDGGHLYTTELNEATRLSSVQEFTSFIKVLAHAAGPIYSNQLSGEASQSWSVLNGGQTLEESPLKLVLNQPDFVIASAVRNRINERFGAKIAVPESPAQISLSTPIRYASRKKAFLRMVQSLLLGENSTIRDEYIQDLVNQLVKEPDRESTGLALEALGKPALDSLSTLLEHPDPSVQFQAARIMIRIGDERPIGILRNVIMDSRSPYRIPAILAVGRNARRNTARPILLNVLNISDLQVRLATYEMLLELQSPEVSRNYIANKEFIVDSVVSTGPKVIYAYQQGTPRIVILGSPVSCDKSIFLQSDDQAITLNASANDPLVTLSRKHPSRPRVIGPVSSSRQLRSIIQTLGELPEEDGKIGLAVPYAEILPFLKKMCLRGAVNAEFVAGPEFDLGVEF